MLPLLLQALPVPQMPDLPACDLGRGARLIARKAELPVEAISELDRQFRPSHGLAEAGGYFETSDSVSDPTAPQSRFMRAYNSGEFWFIWYESGGIARSFHVIALRPLPDGAGEVALHFAPGSHFVSDLCAGSKAYLMGARSPG